MEQGRAYLAKHLESDFLNVVERGIEKLDDSVVSKSIRNEWPFIC